MLLGGGLLQNPLLYHSQIQENSAGRRGFAQEGHTADERRRLRERYERRKNRGRVPVEADGPTLAEYVQAAINAVDLDRPGPQPLDLGAMFPAPAVADPYEVDDTRAIRAAMGVLIDQEADDGDAMQAVMMIEMDDGAALQAATQALSDDEEAEALALAATKM